MPPPTAAPTRHIVPWLIGETEITCNDCFANGLIVENEVGSAIEDTSKIDRALFLKDCSDERPNDSTQFVNLGTEDFVTFPSTYIYNILFNQDTIDSDTGDFITCDTLVEDSCTKGTVEFCTRVSTYNGSVEKTFRETNFILDFDLANSTFGFTHVNATQAPTPEPTNFPSSAPSTSHTPTLVFVTQNAAESLVLESEQEMTPEEIEAFEETMIVYLNFAFKDEETQTKVTNVEVIGQQLVNTRLAGTQLQVDMNVTARVFDEDAEGNDILTDAIEEDFEEGVPPVLQTDIYFALPDTFDAYAPSDPPSLSPSTSPAPSGAPSAAPSNSPLPSMTPSTSPLPSMEPSVSPAPSIEPTIPPPTESPTSFIKPWLVGTCNVELGEDFIRGSNEIGFKGAVNDVSVSLFDYECVNEKDLMNSTNAVTIFNTTQPGSMPGDLESFLYDINISESNIGSDTGGFVTTTTEPGTGEVKFCTRISTHEGSIEVAFRECNFHLIYDLTAGFNLTSIDISENEVDTFNSTLETKFEVSACQCDDFVCKSKTEIKQDESLTMCLFPTDSGVATDKVTISNFNLRLYAGTPRTPEYVEYNPVWFSTDSWESDALTLVTEKRTSETEVIMIQTAVIAQFYVQNHEEISVDGNVFLEFDSSKKAQSPEFSTFTMIFGLEPTIAEGCLKTILNKIREFF